MAARRKSPFHVTLGPNGPRASARIGGVRISSTGRVSTRVGGVSVSTKLGAASGQQPGGQPTRPTKPISKRAALVWVILGVASLVAFSVYGYLSASGR